MKTVARYLDNDNNAFDGSYVSTLIKPKQVFVNGVVAYDPAESRATGLLQLGPKVTNFTLVDGSTTDSVIGAVITFSNVDVGTIYLLFSSTQTTPPTPAQIKANGVAFPGNTTTFTIGNLVPAQVYYGWLLAEDSDGNESEITPSVPPSFQTGQYIDFIHAGLILDPRVTFTRASTATRVNEVGLIEVVQNDIPRVDHDPVTLAQKGLLIEEERTNNMTVSNNLQAWTKSGITTTSSTDFPIFANGNVWLLQGNGTSGAKHINRTFTASSSIRTASAFLRRGTNDFAQFFVFTVDVYANFNLATGQVGSSNGVISSTITPWRDGWYRCTMTYSVSNTSTFAICIVSSTTVGKGAVNTLNTSIYAAGVQLEEGSFATSYIPTTTTGFTRAGDFASITGSNFSSWYNPLQGTFVVGFQKLYSGAADLTRTLLSGDGSINKRLIYLVVNSDRVASFDGDTVITATGDATGPFVKCALAYSSPGGRSIALGGTNAVAGTLASGASTVSYITIGSLNGSEVMCGWIRSLMYYPTRLSDAEIKTLSA